MKLMEKEFDYTTKEGYTFEGWITNGGKWPESEEIMWDFEFGFITDPKGKYIDETLKNSGVDIVNSPIFEECFDYITSEDFWKND